MTDEELQKDLLLTQVRSLIIAYEERFGVNPYVTLKLEELDVRQLATLRRNLHEVLYAPPPRSR
jgi:hypothetical protein